MLITRKTTTRTTTTVEETVVTLSSLTRSERDLTDRVPSHYGNPERCLLDNIRAHQRKYGFANEAEATHDYLHGSHA